MHVGIERIHSLNDGLIADLRIGMTIDLQHFTGSHHARNIDASCEGIDWDFGFHSLGSDFLSDLQSLLLNLKDDVTCHMWVLSILAIGNSSSLEALLITDWIS